MHPIFGKRPSGNRLARIKKSPQYKGDRFYNFSPTPQLTQKFTKAIFEYFFKKSKELKPFNGIPSMQVNWKMFNDNTDCLIWFGHSSYIIKTEGKIILIDPVFSGSASPIPGGGKAFKGSDVVKVSDLPNIDYLLISHDHYDHMDYKTLKLLKNKVDKVVVSLGVGSHLEHWGFDSAKIYEGDWWDEFKFDNGFTITLTPARHFSGRNIWSANTLWTSFVLKISKKSYYLGGDSGYDLHFKNIGEKLGPFDLAILENGQYNKSWKHIHMMPEETVQAALDLNANFLLPVHSSKFVLSIHAWYEPLERVFKASKIKKQPLLTPQIGEVVDLNRMYDYSNKWWIG